MLEGLVALLVLSLGMFSVGRIHALLRLNGDLGRQRAEAVRIAQLDLERLRAFSVIPRTDGARAYADVVSATTDMAAGSSGSVVYRVERQVADVETARAKAVSIAVRWDDRQSAAHEVVLGSMIAGTDPGYSGALDIARADGIARGIARAPGVPLSARNLGDGTSAFKPRADGSVVVVVDNLTGRVGAHCTGAAPALANADLRLGNLGRCSSIDGLLLSGTIRYAPPGPDDTPAADALPDVDIMLTLRERNDEAAAPYCATEAQKTVAIDTADGRRLEAAPLLATPPDARPWVDTGDRYVAYHCIVIPASGRTSWSGRSTLVPTGWTIGTGVADRRVCRYSADLDGSGSIDANAEHPATYASVDAALTNQNFLVVPGERPCPTAPPGTPNAVSANLATVQHQP